MDTYNDDVINYYVVIVFQLYIDIDIYTSGKIDNTSFYKIEYFLLSLNAHLSSL
jgi:hypothetical protein